MCHVKQTFTTMKFATLILALLAVLFSFGQTENFDLVVKNATVFDSRKGTLSANQTIFIKGGLITKVTGRQTKYAATKTIDAGGKLVTSGFVDTHIHPTDVYRSYGALPEYFEKDSLPVYRKRLSDAYLPYGITCAMIMGQSEKWLPPILGWQADSQPGFLDLYTVGGALVSNEGRKPYINHAVVDSPLAAKQKVISYYKLGIRHVKLYWKLRRPEFEAAFKTADSLGMRVYGHVDQNVMFMDSTLDAGLRNYEHILTLATSVLHLQNEDKNFALEMNKQYAPGTLNLPVGKFIERLEMFRFIRDEKPAAMASLLDRLSKNNTTFSTGFHLLAEQFGLAYFTTGAKADASLSAEQAARCKENFTLFMAYVKRLFDNGIKLRIGTDWPNGGKAFVSEQLLLAEYGFPIPAILQISTLNGAAALGLNKRYGSIEKGQKADLLVWDKSPFDDYRNFLASKTVIKNGVVFAN